VVGLAVTLLSVRSAFVDSDSCSGGDWLRPEAAWPVVPSNEPGTSRPFHRRWWRRGVLHSQLDVEAASVIRSKREVGAIATLRLAVQGPGVRELLVACGLDVGMQVDRLALADGAFATRDSRSCQRRRRSRSRRHGRALALAEIEHKTNCSLEVVDQVLRRNVNSARVVIGQSVSRITRRNAAGINPESEVITQVELDTAAIKRANLKIVIQVRRLV
jgi:hypothetical protein